MFLAASDIASMVDEAFLVIGGICLVMLIGITAVMLVFLFRYRAKRNPEAARIEGNTPLEVTWIVIPTLIVLYMFYKGYEGFRLMRSVPEGAMVIKVEARQWAWTFIYPEQGVSTSELFVPVKTAIKLELTSPADDVVHSFYLPSFRVKEDCVPGRETYLWFRAEREGTHNIFCAEFCGKDHSKMISRLHVLAREGFRDWLEAKVAERNKPIDMARAMDPASEEVVACDAPSLYATYCAACHGRSGRGGLVEGARDFTSIEGWKKGTKLVDIYRTLEEGIQGTQMRSFKNLPRWDRFALTHHVAAFYPRDDRPGCNAEDIARLVKDSGLDRAVSAPKGIPIEQAMLAIVEEAERDARDKERQ